VLVNGSGWLDSHRSEVEAAGMTREAVAVESRIEQVTVYARGARVRRAARVHAPSGGIVRVVGLPLALIDDSVRVEVDGAAVVTAVRAGVDVAAGEPAAESSEEVRAANRNVLLAEGEVERLARALEQLAGAPLIAEAPPNDPPAEWEAVVAARRELLALRTERERDLRDRHAAARRELAEARRAYEVAVERDARAGSAHAAKLHELRKHVELELASSSSTDVVVHVEYQVAAARWAPSYVARLDGARASWELRAVVAQHSGEDWDGVALRLSTAEPDRFAELPELPPQKIGRRQPEPARRGFRPPPVGADALYLDYARAFPAPAAPPIFTAASARAESAFQGRAPAAMPTDELVHEVWDDASSLHHDAEAAELDDVTATAVHAKTTTPLPGAGPMAAPPASPAPRRERSRAPKRAAHEPSEPPPRLDYGNLRMAPPSAHERGRLVPVSRDDPDERAANVATGESSLLQLLLPPGYFAEWSHAYDYAFDADGTVDVHADAKWHSIAVTARSGTVELRHVTVPREQADVFRIATLVNPFDGPLLPGPIDVYDRGQFLITSSVASTPPAASVELGLGVDRSVKVARNVEFREEAAGMLRGTLRLVHAITIELENLSARQVDVEVRERVPVVRDGDDDVEVMLGKTEPPWERFTPDPAAPRELQLRGGYRWRMAVAAGDKQLLRAGYEVKIAGKLEVVGGNRREP
jgi:hypothetical protein